MDYYKILEIDKKTSPEEIKKAFRKKAHKYHPDKKGGDEKKFKEINEAYQILSDPQKKAQYDQFGANFNQAGGESTQSWNQQGDFDFGNVHFNMDDLGDVFSDIGSMFGFGNKRRQNSRVGSDLQITIEISFQESVFGIEKEIQLRKKVSCDKCHGNGAEPDSKIENCSNCQGSGRISKIQNTILGSMKIQSECPNCQGEGKTYSKKCSQCHGSGIMEKMDKIKIKIPAGIDDQGIIRLAGQGEAGEKGTSAGNLYIKIKINNNTEFVREGYDIKSNREINFVQASLGDKIDIKTVDDKKIKLKIPAGTQSETVFRLRNSGIPRLRSFGKGDHLIKIIVKIPESLTKKQKKILQELGETF